MYYTYFKKLFPDDILVYIEEFDKINRTVLFDFLDSNEYIMFTKILNTQSDLDKPSMVQLKNYKKRRIQENTIYSIKPDIIANWVEQISNTSTETNSFLIGFEINTENTEGEIFDKSVTTNDVFEFYLDRHILNGGNISQFSFPSLSKPSLIVRNVGQGNWNELKNEDEVKIVFDVGAPTNATKVEVIGIIGNKNSIYKKFRPILILSHWDKDHYHSLLAMTDTELKNNFSAFVCRNDFPNKTSKNLIRRIVAAIGLNNTYAIYAIPKSTKGGKTYFQNINPIHNSIVLYNSEYHKNRNLSGLILSVKSSRASIILPGDAHYEQISRDILPHLNFHHNHNLVVPHHGGNAGAYVYRNPAHLDFKKAVVSAGVTYFKHPLKTNIDALKTDGFEIKVTSIEKRDITVTL